jgi:hypothetical protein
MQRPLAHIFQTFFQNIKVVLISPTLNAGSRCPRHVNHGNPINIVFVFFVQNSKNKLMFYTFNHRSTDF